MKIMNLAVLAALLGGAGLAFAEGKPGAPAAKECPGCVEAKAVCGRDDVGYCGHCGVAMAKVHKDDIAEAKKAVTKAGGTDAVYKNGILTVHVDKKAADAVKKALCSFIRLQD